MSGHSRWSTIKHKKALSDAKKAKGWTKLLKEITVIARSGGDPDANPRLRSAIDKGRAANIPNDTIDRAVRKGCGEEESIQLEELVYQVYGPAGVAVVVELATDNRNRTASELRKLLEKNNAKIDASGSVLHKFKKRGQLIFDAHVYSEDILTEAALELGADDVISEEQTIVVLAEPSGFHELQQKFIAKGLKPLEAEVAMIPELLVELSSSEAESIEKLLEMIEEHEDVLHVYSNASFPTALL